MTLLKDVGWLVLILLLLPLWMGLGLGVLAFAVGKQLLLWARGNTTASSRVGA